MWIVLTKYSNTGPITAVTEFIKPDYVEIKIAEFETEAAAQDAADSNLLCIQFGYQLVEVEL